MGTFFNILMQIVGGLGMFLYGMRVMSESVEEIAGYRLRKLISKMTSNIFKGIMVGAVITAIIQSSSITTVMAVGFVNAGLMTLGQSLGVIFGANIGTTVTGWILALEVTKYGLPILGIGALIFLFSSNNKRRKQALAVMGLGMIFLGLTFMKSGVRPLRDMPQFIRFFYLFSAHSYRGIVLSALMGAALTCVLQSSSATVGITMALASQRIITIETAVALVLGENVGTTITAYLASLGAGAEAKRVAYAHIMIKIIGVMIILPLFYPYLMVISKVIDPQNNITKFIALSHTVFNVGLVFVFLPFMGAFLKLLNRMAVKAQASEREYVNECIYKIPSVTLERSREEILQMLTRFIGDLNLFYNILVGQKEKRRIKDIFEGERYQDKKKDSVQRELTALLNCISSQEILREARLLMKVADEMESMGDYGASLGKIYIKIENTLTVIDERGLNDIKGYHEEVVNHLGALYNILKQERYEEVPWLKESCNRVSVGLAIIDPLEKAEYPDHIVMEILAKYRRVNRHIIYILEELEGGKEEKYKE